MLIWDLVLLVHKSGRRCGKARVEQRAGVNKRPTTGAGPAASGPRLAMGRPWAMDFTESDSAPRVELPKPPGFSESSSHDTV